MKFAVLPLSISQAIRGNATELDLARFAQWLAWIGARP